MNVEKNLLIYDPSLPMSLELQNAIDVNEQVKWVGRPNFRQSMKEVKVLVWISVPILAISSAFIFGATFALETSKLGGVMLIGLGSIFLLIGLFFLMTPVLNWWMCRTTVYVVTTRRAIIVSGLLRSKLESFYQADLERIDCRIDEQGGGNILFLETMQQISEKMTGNRPPPVPVTRGFYSIETARKVEHLLKSIRS